MRPWYPRTSAKVNIHIFGLTKCTIYCKNVPVFLYAVTMLIFQIKIIISSEKWLTTSLLFFFFLENAENLGRSDDAKRRKKERIALDRPRWHAKRKAIKRQIKLVLLLKLLQQLHETRHLREVIRSLSKRPTHYSGSWSFFKYKIIIKFPCKSKLIKFFILRLERTLWVKLTFYILFPSVRAS